MSYRVGVFVDEDFMYVTSVSPTVVLQPSQHSHVFDTYETAKHVRDMFNEAVIEEVCCDVDK